MQDATERSGSLRRLVSNRESLDFGAQPRKGERKAGSELIDAKEECRAMGVALTAVTEEDRCNPNAGLQVRFPQEKEY